MESDNFLENLTLEQTELSSRIFSLIIGRVLKRAYLGFNEQIKKEMDEVFMTGTEEEKTDFMEKKIPDFKNIFDEEAKKIEEALKLEIEKEL